METAIRERAGRKEYDQITSARSFAETLTKDLQAVSKDKHLSVRYSHEPIPVRAERREPTAEEREEARRDYAWMNHGFNKVERLAAISVIWSSGVSSTLKTVGDTVASTMNFLNGTDALIIDLRGNGGGSPRNGRARLFLPIRRRACASQSLYWREGNRTEEFWTRKEVAGKRYLNKDVYVLTSKRTFSGAEEFAYNLKNLKRATIVGETTGGGAHPGGRFTSQRTLQCVCAKWPSDQSDH